MKGKYPCPKCGSNDWEPILWADIPYDECKKCGYNFTSKDVPKRIRITRFDPVKDFYPTQGFRPEWRHGKVEKYER